MIRFPTVICFLYWGACLSNQKCVIPSVSAFVGNNNNYNNIAHYRQKIISKTTTTDERSSCSILFVSSSSSSENNSSSNSNNNSKDYDGFPQLPAIGASSFDPSLASTSFTSSQRSSSGSSSTMKTTDRAFVGSKLELQYTCKVCGTRNCHRVSRIAYQKGLVIATCKGCMGQHLIADHLGWTKHFDGNIEDYLPEQGSEVNRVNEEVFELEKVLNIDTKSGSIVDDKGNRTME